MLELCLMDYTNNHDFMCMQTIVWFRKIAISLLSLVAIYMYMYIHVIQSTSLAKQRDERRMECIMYSVTL